MKKTTLRSAKAKLWKVFSEYVRQRDKGACFTCGKKDNWRNMDAGHYYARTSGLALYFDPRNVNTQCTGCNRFRHGNLPAYALALKSKYGSDILEQLDAERRKTKKYTVAEYQKLIEHYTDLIKNLCEK